MSFDLDHFVLARQRDSDHALLLACLAEMEGGTSGLSSLEIHAPLEVMARYLLLPLVDARRRESARRNLAKAARDFAAVATPPAAGVDETADRIGGDDWAVAPWPAVGRSLGEALGQPQSRRALATRIVQQVGGAGHGQILLHHLLDADLHVRRLLLPHMQMFIRAFCEEPSTEGGAVIPQLGRYREARDRLEEALIVFPGHPGLTDLLIRVLAAAPDPAARDGRRALALAEPLLAAPADPARDETAAMALAEAGRYAAAADRQRRAIAAAERAGNAEAARALAAALRRYEQGRPSRAPLGGPQP